MNIVSTSGFPTTISNSAKLGKGLRMRLDMMAKAKHSGPLRAAMKTAESTVKATDRASDKRASTSYDKGRRFREVLIRTLGIVTDQSGKVAEGVINEKLEADKREKRKNVEQYGDPNPTIIERGLKALGDVETAQHFSRRWLFRGPKVLAREAVFAGGAVFLPWPLSCIAKLINTFRDEKAV